MTGICVHGPAHRYDASIFPVYQHLVFTLQMWRNLSNQVYASMVTSGCSQNIKSILGSGEIMTHDTNPVMLDGPGRFQFRWVFLQ